MKTMIPALALAVLAANSPAAQTSKTLTIDDFTEGGYTTTVNLENGNSHDSGGLGKPHCLFTHRGINFHINSNPNNTTLTITVGNGEQKLSSPLPVTWHLYAGYYSDPGVAPVDLSSVDKFFWDFHTFPGGKLPDLMSILVMDRYGKTGSTGNWLIRPGGVYFRRSDFSNNGVIDWKNITHVQLQQDFDTFPKPTTYALTRFYASVKPVASAPSPGPLP